MPAGSFEARAASLNPRGDPYTWHDHQFPPGEWVTVSEATAKLLGRLDWAEVRPRKPDAKEKS